MLNIEIVCIGKLKHSFFREACDEYIKMASAYANIKVTELAETKISGSGAAAVSRVAEDESARILEYIKSRRSATVAMCIDGKSFTSEQTAQLIKETALTSSNIIFIIGGSNGLSRALTDAVGMRMSMSCMTFPHQLARVILLEQIYRALSINAGGKYHK